MEFDQAKPSYWAVLPAAVRYDPKLAPNAKLLYAEISSLTDQKGYCYASNAYFIRLFELCERTIIRLLRALEAAGYITIEDDQGGRTVRKIYAGVNPAAAYPDKNVTPTPTKLSPPGDKIVTHTKKENSTEDHPPKAPQGAGAGKKPKKKRRSEYKPTPDWRPETFAAFWDAYPRGEAKQAAIKAWDKLHPDPDLLRIMAIGLKRQLESELWKEGIGIPYASTWLNQRRWEDELTPVSVAPPEPPGEEAVEWI